MNIPKIPKVKKNQSVIVIIQVKTTREITNILERVIPRRCMIKLSFVLPTSKWIDHLPLVDSTNLELCNNDDVDLTEFIAIDGADMDMESEVVAVKRVEVPFCSQSVDFTDFDVIDEVGDKL